MERPAPRANSMISAAALRSRSRPNEGHPHPAHAALPAPPGLPAPAEAQNMPSSQQLLLQLVQSQQVQNQLLQQQMDVLRQQTQTPTAYNNPEDMLGTFDPSLQPVLKEWARDYRNALQQHVTQANLQQKYQDIAVSGELHKQFQDESTRSWQWPQAFKANAQELTTTLALLEEGQS